MKPLDEEIDEYIAAKAILFGTHSFDELGYCSVCGCSIDRDSQISWMTDSSGTVHMLSKLTCSEVVVYMILQS